MCNSCIINKPLTINALLKGDPTRTLTLRRRFEADLVRRFKRIRKDISASIDPNDAFGLREVDHTLPGIQIYEALPPKAFAFDRDPAKINKFMEWLNIQINEGVLEIFPGQQVGTAIEDAWTNKYIQSAYQQGILRARQELRKKGYDVPVDDRLTGTIQAGFNQPFHIDKVGAIYTRTYRGLKGITDEMDKQISSVLAQGIAEGRGPKELAKTIVDRVDKIGITRARILARTEVIRAHHTATIQEYRNWGVEGVSVLAEWSTAGDGRVCERCSAMARKDNGLGRGIYTLDQISGLIPLHPQCRCIALPLDVTENELLRQKAQEAVIEVPIL